MPPLRWAAERASHQVRFDPVDRLAGELTPPPDKSISHRAAIVGAMSDGRVRIRGYLRSADTAATLEAVTALGARLVDAQPRGAGLDVELAGAGLRGADPGRAAIDVGNAGTLIRILPGWLAGQPRGRWALQGDESIARRPVDRVVHPLRRMGATVDCREGGLPPLVVEGSDLHGIEYELPVASAQVKSCVLLAGLLAEGDTTVVEPLASRDHTERLLAHFGAEVRIEAEGDGRRITVKGEPELAPAPVVVPADPSSAAFPMVAALLVPGSEVVLTAVMTNPLRTGLITTLREMGADIQALEVRSDEMLLPVLRRQGLLSVRETCGIGVCGACTVLLDGEPVSGCLMLAAAVAGREITTVEGLDEADPVLRVFNEEHAFQCGWCTPGFVLTAKAMRPGEDVREALGGNLCRCGCYVKIEEAVRKCGS